MRYARLLLLRKERGLTQAEVGRSINVPNRTYAYYEAGERMIPPGVLCRLADLYGVSVDYILERTGSRGLPDAK